MHAAPAGVSDFKVVRSGLKNAECCRLCGFGTKITDDEKETTQFRNIFETIFPEETGVDAFRTLDTVINKYLPLKVLQNDF